ncbi:MAG TPA: gluconate:H+ symporter [Chthoniobacter sp.]|jgi:GntP family gluconate:H+ symporter
MFFSLAVLSPNALLLVAAVAIIALILLIARCKINAIIAITIVSLILGLAAGMEPGKVVDAFTDGVAHTMGQLAMIIGLGTMLGKMLAESGGANVVASGIVRVFGAERADYAMMVAAFVIGVSVFFQVGLLLLGPIAFALARETKMPILRIGLPLAAGLSTAHGLIPPHPGPLAAIHILGADIGKTILWSLLVVGPPVALVTGPLLARWVTPNVKPVHAGLGESSSTKPSAPNAPGFGISIFTILLPVLLMLVKTATELPVFENLIGTGGWQSEVHKWADFVGDPTVAMLVAVLFSFWTFGRSCGLNSHQILRFSEDCLAPAAGVLLVISAGGGFSKVLNASGVGDALAAVGRNMHMSPLLLGWLIAGMLRVAVGSATVSVQTAASIMLPLVQADPHINKELLVLSMGAGSLVLSHVNDGGFWLVKEYFGLDIPQTLKTWTVVETGIAVMSITLILIVNTFV